MYPYDDVALSEMDYLDVKNLAQTGEGAFLEFKRTVPGPIKIAREITAFANAKGGTILVGVDDDKSLVGVESYHEEEFLLKKAALEMCRPAVNIDMEIVYFGDRDLMVIRIPESKAKPVFVKTDKGSVVFIRDADQSKAVSRERIRILQNQHSDREITFEYGPDEQKLFRYLNEYSEISVEKFSHLVGCDEQKAGEILVNLASTGILNLFTKNDIDYFTFSYRCKSKRA